MNPESINLKKYYYHAATGFIIDHPGCTAQRIWGENNLGRVTFEHKDVGKYHFKSDGLFKSGLTSFQVSNHIGITTESSVLDENTIEINIKEGGGNPINNRLWASFCILVYHSEAMKDLHFKVFATW